MLEDVLTPLCTVLFGESFFWTALVGMGKTLCFYSAYREQQTISLLTFTGLIALTRTNNYTTELKHIYSAYERNNFTFFSPRDLYVI